MKPRLTPRFKVFFLGSLKDFFSLIAYNPLPPFLFTELPTPDALWEKLRKENKRTVGENQWKTSPLNPRGFLFIFFSFT